MSPWKDYKVQNSNDKFKLKAIKWLYNNLPFSIYKFVIKNIRSSKIQEKLWKKQKKFKEILVLNY